MAVRLIALAVALMMVSVVSFFVVVAFRPSPPVAAGDMSPSMAAANRSTTRLGAWTLTTETFARTGRAEIMLVVSNSTGETSLIRPNVTLGMPGMNMPYQLVPMRQQSGVWRGSAPVSMPGEWTFDVKLNEETVAVPVRVPG